MNIEVKNISTHIPAEKWPERLSNIPFMASHCKRMLRIYERAAKVSGIDFDAGKIMFLGYADMNLDNLNSFLIATKEKLAAAQMTYSTVTSLELFADYTEEILQKFEKKLHDQDVTIKNLQEALCSLSDGKSK